MPTVTEIWNRTGDVDALGRFSFTRRFRVLAENRLVSQMRILEALYTQKGVTIGVAWVIGTPLDSWYETANVYCTRMTCECVAEEDGLAWNVTAFWEPADVDLLTVGAIPVDPTTAPVLVEWGEWAESFALDRDKDGKVITNTAGDRFAEPVDAERHFPLMRVRRKQRTFNAPYYSDYKDTVNDAEWVVRGITIPARVAKCVSITAQPEWHQDFGIFYDVSFEFAIRDVPAWTAIDDVEYQGWDLKLANVGYRFAGTDGNLYLITDQNGIPFPNPVPLTEGGLPIPLPLPDGTDMPTLGYRIYFEKDFSTGFGFPTA